MFDGVVAESRILAYLARTFSVTYSQKRDCYIGWADCQHHVHKLFLVVMRAIAPVYQHRVLNGFRVVASVADRDEDTVWTVSFDDYVPDVDSENSQNDDNLGLLFHRRDRQEVLRHWRLALHEYARCCQSY